LHQVQLDVSHFQAGAYWFCLEDGHERLVRQLLVVK
jgi:hypothetical protein